MSNLLAFLDHFGNMRVVILRYYIQKLFKDYFTYIERSLVEILVQGDVDLIQN